MPDKHQFDWPALNSLPDACDEADKVLLTDLAPWINSSQVSVEHNSDAYFDLIKNKYPIGIHRIDWPHVGGALFYEVMRSDLSEYPLDYRLKKIKEARGVITDWFQLNSIRLNDKIIAVGDVSNVALHMSVATFIECYPVLFTSSQHIYLIPSDAAWCMHYTSEDTINFGLAKNARAVGSVIPLTNN